MGYGHEVTSDKSPSNPVSPAEPLNKVSASANIPLTSRFAHEIPKPKDWQPFQRSCVLLFQAELNDPNAQEYGRGGQNQRGIDILGKRNGDPDHYVGVQCRRIVKPLKEAKILKDCRAALALKANLKEILFATTAPDDTGASDAAIAVERTLRLEGHDLTVVVYGWESLQIKIASHDIAYAAFCPSIMATSAPQASAMTPPGSAILAAQVADHVVAQLRQTGIALPLREVVPTKSNEEDPALHARIDTYRDLEKEQGQPKLAQKGLLALLENEPLDGKPWARFRIETNLGAVALDLGREAEGAARFEAAHALRPDDPTALANLALARTIQGRFEEAMDLARAALGATPRADHAVAILLQAAARSAWQGDPETLIPPDLVDSEYADLGLAEFLRHRDVPGWAEHSLELGRRHPEVDEFKRIGALAVLTLALETGALPIGGKVALTLEELNRAADDMKAVAEHCLAIGFADEHDLTAHLNNAAVLLRLLGRHAECEALLQAGLPQVPNEPSLRRLLALAQAAGDRHSEALATLAAAGDDPESQLLSAELVAIDDPPTALVRALAIDTTSLSAHISWLRWGLIGDLALKTGGTESLKGAVLGLRALDAADVTADLLEIRGQHQAGLHDDAVHEKLRGVVAALPPDVDMMTRFFVAAELHRHDLPAEVLALLEGHVDLTRRSPATMLYLQNLASGRRDEAFREAVAATSSEVRNDPETLWMVAAHAWNIGDLPDAADAVEALLAQQPDNPRARLIKIEILIRQDRSAELLAELDKPVENLTWRRLQDRFRIASLLNHFGYIERAATFAYRLFLEHRDNSQAWMTLSMLVLEEGRGKADGPRSWDVPVAAPNVAVDLRYDDGEEVFVVVEPDASLRMLDEESWEPEHPLVQSVLGLAAGARFVGQNGRAGMITNLRHKYVARLHYVMKHFEGRFPTVQGFRSVSVDFERPGGLDKLIAELKARHDWFEQEQEQYRNGPWPLGVLAYRLGLDVIEVAGGLASEGVPLKVAMGNEPERKAAAQAVRENAQKGCILDLLAFWTAWQLQALDAIVATCGPIHVTQSVMDSLRARRERIDYSAKDGLRSARYEAGKLAVHEIAPEVIVEWRDDVDRAIAWAVANATVCPLVVGEDLPSDLREHLRAGRSDIFDSIVLAMQAEVLLVTDDLPTREFSRIFGGGGGTWLHQVFGVALDQRHINLDTYIRWSAHLVDNGHDYIGVSGLALARALRMDAEAGQAPGYFFKTLIKVIGGRSAEPQTHIVACLICLEHLWSDNVTTVYRQPATGLLLWQLQRERYEDYGIILQILLREVQNLPQLVNYIHDWARGHFILEALIGNGSVIPPKPLT